jgi:exopolysaccharide biosynthesis protein
MSGTTDSFKTPSSVYADGKWPIVINAGFFYSSGGKNYSSSLAVKDSKVLAYNINYASEDWVTIYYPTRAAFMESEDGKFDACWTYYKSGGKHYMYSSPAENTWAARPAKTPSAIYPDGAETFAAKTAIGGGPLLIDKGKFKDTYVEELFNGASGIGPDTNQPRTAMGATSDGKMILFVCEGRQMTEGVAGLTTADVANVLLDLGCVEAINLDGGGSSCMLVNGKQTIKVSDGKQRAVGSTVMIK